MIEDISQDHPDRMRIVIALNAGQCPDCDGYGFDFKPRVGISRNIFCKACDQGFNVAPDPHESVFRAAHWPPFARVTFFSTRSPAQIVNKAARPSRQPQPMRRAKPAYRRCIAYLFESGLR